MKPVEGEPMQPVHLCDFVIPTQVDREERARMPRGAFVKSGSRHSGEHTVDLLGERGRAH